MSGSDSKVIIAEDHPLYRSALADLVASAPDLELVGAAAELQSAIELLEQGRCDLLILDLRMPGVDGLADVMSLHQRWPATKIVIISGNLDAEVVAEGLTIGVVGFLPKSLEPETILAAIRLVLTGATYVPHDIAPASVKVLPIETPQPRDTSFTAREVEILKRMAKGETYKEIARSLDLAEITIKLHAQRIARKLGAKNRSAAVAKAIKDRHI